MPSVVLVTGHYLRSQRRAGFHWLADALHRQGWRVTFMTAPISWMSRLRRDHRMQYPVREEANRLLEVAPNLYSYVWWTRWHPSRLRHTLLDRMATGFFTRYGSLPLGPVEAEVRGADLIIFESTPAIALHNRFRDLNPDARMVYRVSDDMALLRLHALTQEIEAQVAPEFDLVSTPTATLHAKFAHLANARLDPHGVPGHLYDAANESPYEPGTRNLVFAGVTRFDPTFITTALDTHADLRYHVIGPVGGVPAHPSVTAHGELPYHDTVPFIRHASIGLQTIRPEAGIEVFADSLKMQQYSWCGLPIIAPARLKSTRPNVVAYDTAHPQSVSDAIDTALAMDRDPAWGDGIPTWDDVAGMLADTPTPDRPARRAPAVDTIGS